MLITIDCPTLHRAHAFQHQRSLRYAARLVAPIALALLLAIAGPIPVAAQHSHGGSITRQQWEQSARYTGRSERQWDSANGRVAGPSGMQYNTLAATQGSPADTACRLQNASVVFGWHPYWAGTAYTGYNYSLLSDICYFSYDVDPATGSYKDIHSWRTTEMVTLAKQAGVRVHLCVVLFSDHALFLSNQASRKRLIDSLVALVRLRGANGVNIDFEAVPGSQRAALASFMVQLGQRFHTELPGSRVSIALPAVDWSNAFDVATMAQAVDLFLIMGYDYHWSGSENSGPVSPKNNGTLWSAYDVTRSVNYYLGKGIPPAQLALGVPYYGYEWPTATDAPGAATNGTGTAVVYSTARAQAVLHGSQWDVSSSTPYYTYKRDSVWRQCWYDDSISLRMKYDMVRMKGLAGIGIWALGYDGANGELWNAIRDAFSTCAAAPCSGSFSDMGGPAGNYDNYDNFTYTIAPTGAATVAIDFKSFNVADDQLSIFDGRDTNARLIGRYSGTTSPGRVVGTSGALTFAFAANAATVSWGWTSTWSCTQLPSSAPPRTGTNRLGNRGSEMRGTLTARFLPNPAKDVVEVHAEITRTADLDVVLTDMSGREMRSAHAGPYAPGTATLPISLAGLPAGDYLLRATASAPVGATSTAVVVVQH